VIEHQATIIEPEDIVVDGFDFEIKNDDDDDDFDLNKMINEVDALGTEISEGKKSDDSSSDSDDLDSLEDALNSLSTFDS